MCKTFRTLSMMMVVLFALFCLPGGKWLSSASATTPTHPETATMKFTWGGVYTDEAYAPYIPDSGFPHDPTNPAAGFGVELRDYDNGVDGTMYNYWSPTYYPFSFSIPVAPYSHTTPVPYLCTPSYFSTLGANTKSVTAVDHAYTFYPTPSVEQYPFINDGSVTHSGTVQAIKVDDQDWYMDYLSPPSSGTLQSEAWYYPETFDPGSAPNGKIELVSIRNGGNTVVGGPGGVLIIKSNPTLYNTIVEVTYKYTFDQYDSGWLDWEETIPYNKNADGTDRVVPTASISFHIYIHFGAPPQS